MTALTAGAYQKDACAYAGIDVSTFENWLKRYPDFSDRVSRARERSWVGDLAAIRKAALSGDWRAAAEHLDRTGSPYKKTHNVDINFQIRKKAEQLAEEFGLPLEEVMAEADAVAAGAWDRAWSAKV